ncbi:preprotein translocase subunit SecG [candidate division KSB1 bacterium]|nr:preprotein translocase subunit SecG [candidate division KSB1 bacterium]
MYTFLIILHVLVCIVLSVVILLQSSKGGGLAGVFGGGGMGAVFGGRGAATFLSRVTTIAATVFMLLSLLLGLITRGTQTASSIVSEERSRARVSSPADVLPTVPTEGVQEETFPMPAQSESNEETAPPESE